MASFGFENGLGFLAFLSLIPFIILYFIRPKPRELDVPSLMFFVRAKSVEKEKSFFRRFTKDWLFILQLIIFLLLSLHFVSPYLSLGKQVFVENSVIVLDGSASMKVESRIKEAVEIAKDSLGKKNSIIIIGTNPRIGLQDASEEEAERFLNNFKALDSRSSIGESILLAGELIKGKAGKVVVASDFINTDGVNVDIAVASLRNDGISVELYSVGKDKTYDNRGIVKINVDENVANVYVKNFGDEEKKVDLEVNDFTKKLNLKPNSLEVFSFETPQGVTKISLREKDEFLTDNFAYINNPSGEKIKVLYITNENSVFLDAALNSLKNVDVKITKLPIIPEDEYDVYVIGGVNRNNVITGNFEFVRDKVENGKSLVIHVQDDIKGIDFKGLLPLKIGERKGYAVLNVEQLNKITKDVEFGSVSNYLTTYDENGAKLVTAENETVLLLSRLGKGKVVYFGILEDSSDFKFSPSYPIFWANLIKFLSGYGDIIDVNVETGYILNLDSREKIKGPKGEILSQKLTLDDVGIYEVGNVKYAVNLVSEKESDINYDIEEKEVYERSVNVADEKIRYNVEILILIISAVIIFIELVITKMRGDV